MGQVQVSACTCIRVYVRKYVQMSFFSHSHGIEVPEAQEGQRVGVGQGMSMWCRERACFTAFLALMACPVEAPMTRLENRNINYLLQNNQFAS